MEQIFTDYEISVIKGILKYHYSKIGNEVHYDDNLDEEIKHDFEVILEKLEKLRK